MADFARFADLSDAWLAPAFRGRDPGRWLMATLLAHPAIGPVRWLLHTADARLLRRPRVRTGRRLRHAAPAAVPGVTTRVIRSVGEASLTLHPEASSNPD